MTSKNAGVFLKDNQQPFLNNTDYDSQYFNLSLNQNHKSQISIPAHSFNKSNKNKFCDSTVFNDSEEKKKTRLWNKSTSMINLSSKISNSSILNDDTIEESSNYWKNKESSTKNTATKSTLSLYIEAYENSVENDTVIFDGKRSEDLKEKKSNQIFTKSAFVFQNPFEFPRQQENDKNKKPEIAQFKASQKLFHPNKSLSSKNFQHENGKPANLRNLFSTNNVKNNKGLTTSMATASSTDRFKSAVEAIGSKDIVSNAQERIANLGLRVNQAGNLDGYHDYMHAKRNKLIYQVHSNVIKKSDIFKGISFFIDGLTHPPANEIRDMIVEHGGQYHHYYYNGTTTYYIAEELASTKVDKVRKEQRIIKPTFITDSIRAGKVLPVAEYYLLNKNEGNHVNQFFDRSRLHLISTMAKELKKFVAEMKENKASHKFTGRTKLAHLKSSIKITVPIICHIDMDCFFVSVALRNRPDLVGKPVAITHSTATGQANGEIASCSYEARAKGCRARQFVRHALQLCPNLQCLPYQFDQYVTIAKQLYSIISTYTLQIQAVSCDELYFDLGSICQECDISDPLALITIIRNDIFEQTKCIASAGLGTNGLIARMATKKAKPNGQYYVQPEQVQNFIGDAPISDLPTVGWQNLTYLQQQFGSNVTLCKQLFDCTIEDLRKVLGAANGEKVYHALRGKCEPLDFDNIVIDQKSVSVNVNFGIRLKNEKDLKDTFKSVSTELSNRLNDINKTGTSLTVKLLIREPDAPLEPAKYGGHGPCFAMRRTITVSKTSDPEIIYNASMKMIQHLKPVITDIRGVALHMTKLFSVGTVATKKAGTLWDFMKAKNVASKTNGGETKAVLGAFEWVPKVPKVKKKVSKKKPEDDENYYSPTEDQDQDEMRMKISDVCKMMPYEPPPAPSRKCVKYSEPPATQSSSQTITLTRKPIYREVSRGKILVDGIAVYFNKPPEPHHPRKLLSNFTKHVKRMNISPMIKMFEHLTRFVANETAPAREEWKPLLESMKRYLNLYCFNYHNSKIYDFDEDPDDDVEFSKFVKDVIRKIFPKKRRAPSPDLFAEDVIPGNEMLSDDNEVEVTDEVINVPSSQESDECQILSEPGPSTSKANNATTVSSTKSISKTIKDITPKSGLSKSNDNNGGSTKVPSTRTSKNIAPKSVPSTSKANNDDKIITVTSVNTSKDIAPKSGISTSKPNNGGITLISTKTNSATLNPGPSTTRANNGANTTVSSTKPIPKTSKDITPKSGPLTSEPNNGSKVTTVTSAKTNSTTVNPGPSTSKANNGDKIPAFSTKPISKTSTNIASKSGPSTSEPNNGSKITTVTSAKTNSTTVNPGPSTSSKTLTTVHKPTGTISKPSPPTAAIFAPKPLPIPSRPNSAASKQKPSTSKNSKAKKPLPKPILKKHTSFNIGDKRKQPALEDLWNKVPITKKKRVSLPTRTTLDDSVCIIEDDLNQSVIPLN